VGDLPPDQDIAPNQHLLIISRDQSWLTHGFHKYPAKFFPELPRWAIRRYSPPGGVVLDPMAGSGTTNVECLLAGRHSLAVDVDPFARLLIRVKTTPLEPEQVACGAAAITEALDAFEREGPEARRHARDWVPEFPYRETWFQPFILEELGAIRHAIAGVAGALEPGGAGALELDRVQSDQPRPPGETEAAANAQRYVDFFRICLSSIVREVSNADNNCTRTVVRTRLHKRIVPGMALRLFRRTLDVNVARMRQFSEHCPRHVRVAILDGADARDLPLERGSIDLAVTSPPYINAVDYPRTHQLEMYLLDLVPPGVPLAEAKRQHIGTEVVRARDYRELHRYGHKPLDALVEALFRIDPRRAYIVYRYFVDMERNFREVHRVLKPAGRYVVVVGNNVIRGREVPTHELLMAVAERTGFQIETYFASEVIRHYIKVPRKERISQDWVLVLKR
jgi:DNA modification methylase